MLPAFVFTMNELAVFLQAFSFSFLVDCHKVLPNKNLKRYVSHVPQT